MDIKVKFGLRIKSLREEREMTQKVLAYRSDLDRSYIASIERGKRNVSLVNIERLSNALDIPLSKMMEDI